MDQDEKIFECLMSEKQYADERIAAYTESNQKIMALMITVVAAVLSFAFAQSKAAHSDPTSSTPSVSQVNVSLFPPTATQNATPPKKPVSQNSVDALLTSDPLGGQALPYALLISSLLLSLATLQGNYYSGLCFLYIDRKSTVLGELIRRHIALSDNPFNASERFKSTPIFLPYFLSVEFYFVMVACVNIALAWASIALSAMLPHGNLFWGFAGTILLFAFITAYVTLWMVIARIKLWFPPKKRIAQSVTEEEPPNLELGENDSHE